MGFALFVFTTAALLAISNAADSSLDVNRLIHVDRQSAPPQQQSQKLPTNANRPGGVVSQRVPAPAPAPSSHSSPAQEDTTDEDEFVPSKGVRHDEFDWSLTKAALVKNNTNMLISPFLAKLLMSLLAEAAGPSTSTERELASVWPTVQSPIFIREHYGRVFQSLKTKSDDYDLNLGVKVYVDEFINPGQRYQAIAETFYDADIEKLDFTKVHESTEHINGWVRNVTKDFIKEIVTEDDVESAVIILLNAMYFNGYWRRPFAENQTAALPFKIDARKEVQAHYMDITANFFYMEDRTLDAKVIRLPYKGRKYAMFIILPNRVEGLNELLQKVDSSTLQRVQWLMDETEVRVLLPKFKFDNEVHLNEVLKELGIRNIFTNKASLPLLARGNGVQDRLQVSQVLQKAGIDVNERGSTVYAATQITLTNKFGGDYEFRVDRPFFFLIQDESTGTVLFAGKVVNPTY